MEAAAVNAIPNILTLDFQLPNTCLLLVFLGAFNLRNKAQYKPFRWKRKIREILIFFSVPAYHNLPLMYDLAYLLCNDFKFMCEIISMLQNIFYLTKRWKIYISSVTNFISITVLTGFHTLTPTNKLLLIRNVYRNFVGRKVVT